MLCYKLIRASDLSQDDINNTIKLLSNEQLDYINSLCEKRKIQSLAVRTALNLLINEQKLDVSVSSLTFDNSNKPYFKDSDVFLSLTHSEEYVGCVVADASVGIDIEKIKTVKDSVINRVCNIEEQNYILNNGMSSFFTIWTLKEAYIKANGFDCTKIEQINTVRNNYICFPQYEFLTGEISEYKWSIIKKQR